MKKMTMQDIGAIMGIVPWGILLEQLNTPAGYIGLAIQLIGLGMLVGSWS